MFRWWKRVFREYFTFHSGERHGIFILLAIIIISLILPMAMQWMRNDPQVDFSTFKKQIDSFEAQSRHDKDSLHEEPSLYDLDQEKKLESSSGVKTELFNFDPNTATEGDFQRLGLSNRVTRTIMNYREKGGKFFKNGDFKKVYGLKENDYLRLEPYIQISAPFKSELPSADKGSVSGIVSDLKIIDLNQADSLQLVSLTGIGPVLSSRIMKYRNKLGGFYSVEQLKEVYGLKPETLEGIRSKVFADKNSISKIRINEVSFEELKLHPYFKSIALPLINYRQQHGNFKSLADLLNVDVITSDLAEKISPYLEF